MIVKTVPPAVSRSACGELRRWDISSFVLALYILKAKAVNDCVAIGFTP